MSHAGTWRQRRCPEDRSEVHTSTSKPCAQPSLRLGEPAANGALLQAQAGRCLCPALVLEATEDEWFAILRGEFLDLFIQQKLHLAPRRLPGGALWRRVRGLSFVFVPPGCRATDIQSEMTCDPMKPTRN
jgi:hypothetical protein